MRSSPLTVRGGMSAGGGSMMTGWVWGMSARDLCTQRRWLAMVVSLNRQSGSGRTLARRERDGWTVFSAARWLPMICLRCDP